MRTFFLGKILKHLNKNYEHFTHGDTTIWVIKDKTIALFDGDSIELLIDILKEAVL